MFGASAKFIVVAALVSTGVPSLAQADVADSPTNNVQSADSPRGEDRVTRAKARGSLRIVVSLPKGEKLANVYVTGPRGFKARTVKKSTTLTNVPVGTYTIKARATKNGKAVPSSKTTQTIVVKQAKKTSVARVSYRKSRKAVRFGIRTAVGVALGKAPKSTRSTAQSLLAVQPNGSVSLALTQGSLHIKRVFVVGDVMYVDLGVKQLLRDGEPLCALAAVPRTTGIPTCVDFGLEWMAAASDFVGGQGWKGNDPIQVDSAGAVYYLASRGGREYLKRSINGRSFTLTSPSHSITDFLVLPSGGVFLVGSTVNQGTAWLRYLTPDGALRPLSTSQVQFLARFSDGDVYVGLWGPRDFGVKRYLTGDPTDLQDGGFLVESGLPDPSTYSRVCGGTQTAELQGFCSYSGSSITRHIPMSGSDLVLAGWPGTTSLFRYTPVLEPVPSGIVGVSHALDRGRYLVLSGEDGTGRENISIVDTGNDSHRLLLAGGGLEIFNLEPGPSDDVALFTGLRFSDNAYVFGEVLVADGEVKVRSKTGSKWDDFQTFSRK